VREAADREVRAFDPAGERERLLEVSAGVVQAQRPQLGDPEVHPRGRPKVVVGCFARRLRL
jgi:hypothetical protein